MANLDDLKDSWQSQSGISKERFDQIGAGIRNSTNLLQKVIFGRDMVETCASVLVVAFVSALMFRAKNWIDWSGYVMVAIAGITIPIVLWWARLRSIATVSAANLRDFVDVEIGYLRRQILVLRWVALWYILPIYIGMVLIMIGLTGPQHSRPEMVVLAVCQVLIGCLCLFIWWLNQRASKTHLEPLLDHYIQMRNALANGEELVTQLADPPAEFLRPQPRKPMSQRWRRIWLAITVGATLLTLASGIAAMQHFDARAGKFIISTAPVVTILMIVVSGIWRQGPNHER